MTRRDFVSRCAAAGTGVGLATIGPLVSSAHAALPRGASTGLSRAWFSEQLGTSFIVETASGQRLETTLVDVRENSRAAGLEQFTITLRGPWQPEVVLPSGTYVVSHPSRPRFALYLDSPAPGPARQVYQATFNLLV
jgi:hypothetical protein